MKLTDLDGCFISQYKDGNFHEQRELSGAQGVMFICPLCQGHMVACWFKNPIGAEVVPADAEPKPGRWTQSGNGLNDLTLSPSVNLDCKTPEYYQQHPNACRWHGWVKNGDAQ